MNFQRGRTLIFAAALFPAEAPLDERVKVLSKFIKPIPGSELKLDEYALKEFAKKDKGRGLIYGNIEINPPKETCFTITRSLGKPDSEVCKKTQLRWQLQDLDRHTGKLSWSIKTGPNDFGTPLTWNTSYIIAKIIPAGFDFNEANSIPLFIASCEAAASDPEKFMSRRVNLKLLNGETWTIRFPEEDELLPAYEPPLPPPPQEDEKKKKKAAAHGEGVEPEPETKPIPPKPEAWTLSTRRGYVMHVSQVISGGSAAAKNSQGKCRYQYDGVPGDFDTGRIECHYGDNFLYFYAPLPCLKHIRPTAKK